MRKHKICKAAGRQKVYKSVYKLFSSHVFVIFSRGQRNWDQRDDTDVGSHILDDPFLRLEVVAAVQDGAGLVAHLVLVCNAEELSLIVLKNLGED